MGMGGTWLGLFLAGSLSLLAVGTVEDQKCDVKKTRVDRVCAECDELVGNAKEHCGATPVKVEHCVKEVWVCEDCAETSEKPGKCPGCENKMAKSEDLARVFYECPECGGESESKGKCEECDKTLVRTCDKSGSAPHVAPSKKDKKDKDKEKEKEDSSDEEDEG